MPRISCRLRCDINSLNRLGNVLAQEEAQRRHADTAILCRQDTNLITESTDANFFIVKDGLIWTHPEGHLIRSGVTRAQLLGQIFPQLQLTVVEKAFAPAFALTAEEAFVASTVRGIAPVTKIDGKEAIGIGRARSIRIPRRRLPGLHPKAASISKQHADENGLPIAPALWQLSAVGAFFTCPRSAASPIFSAGSCEFFGRFFVSSRTIAACYRNDSRLDKLS